MTDKVQRTTDPLMIVLFLTLIVAGFCISGYGFYLDSYLLETEIVEEVPCYDRYNNKINGVTCEQQYYPTLGDNFGYVFSGMLMLMVGIIGFALELASIRDRKEEYK